MYILKYVNKFAFLKLMHIYHDQFPPTCTQTQLDYIYSFFWILRRTGIKKRNAFESLSIQNFKQGNVSQSCPEKTINGLGATQGTPNCDLLNSFATEKVKGKIKGEPSEIKFLFIEHEFISLEH